MPIDSVIEENIAKLMKERNDTKKEYETLQGTSIQQLWLNELHELKTTYQTIQAKLQSELSETSTKSKKTVVKKSQLQEKGCKSRKESW